MKYRIAIILLLLSYTLNAQTTEAVYTPADSVKIERILNELKQAQPNGSSEATVQTARKFIGTPYVSGALDESNNERLIIDTDRLDCTTFVEIVTAIVLTHLQNKDDFTSFCANLERIRYRNGRCNGYESRLHYMSQWIADSAKTGIIEEITGHAHCARQSLDLSFMSKHPDNYPQLKNNKPLTEKIAQFEKPFRQKEIAYIPKTHTGKNGKTLGIKNGDIITLVTTVEGLDVTHCGFAFFSNDSLHLIHASSSKEKVIADDISLYNYQKNKKSQSGIRVFRICD